MTNEEKILELLMGMQKNFVELKLDVMGLKQDVTGLKEDVSGLKVGQQRLEAKVDELNKNQYVMQQDMTFLVRKTMENCDDIHILKVAAGI